MSSGPSEIRIGDIPVAETPTDAKPLAFTNFARRSTLRRSGGRLHGIFSPSFAGACLAGLDGYIELDSIQGMSDAGRCSGSNEVVVRIDHL